MPIVWLFCLTLGFMEVIEFGAANWGGLYLKDVYGLDPRVVGASFVSLFYVLFTVSRLFSGLAIEKIGYLRSLFLALGCTILIYLVRICPGRAAGSGCCRSRGFFIGIMWPTMMAVAMRVFGADAPAVHQRDHHRLRGDQRPVPDGDRPDQPVCRRSLGLPLLPVVRRGGAGHAHPAFSKDQSAGTRRSRMGSEVMNRDRAFIKS